MMTIVNVIYMQSAIPLAFFMTFRITYVIIIIIIIIIIIAVVIGSQLYLKARGHRIHFDCQKCP